MHNDQLNVDASTARFLIHQQFPRFRDEDVVAIDGAGTVNAIFRIGSAHAARFPLLGTDPDECARLLQAEAQASAEFSACCPFPSPRPIGLGQPGAGYPLPWLVQTLVEGELATPTGLGASSAFAGDLIRLIVSLRSVEIGARAFDGRGRGGRLRDHDEWVEHCFTRSEGLLDVPRLRRMWARFRDLPAATRLVMSPKDLTPANLLVQGDRLVGVLDTGGFGPADASLDLVAAWHMLDEDGRAALRDALGASDLEWLRGAAWAFEQALGLVWYYRDTNPRMSALGVSTLSRLLAAGGELMP